MPEMWEKPGKYDGLGCFLGALIGIPLSGLIIWGGYLFFVWAASLEGWAIALLIIGAILFMAIGAVLTVLHDTKQDRRN